MFLNSAIHEKQVEKLLNHLLGFVNLVSCTTFYTIETSLSNRSSPSGGAQRLDIVLIVKGRWHIGEFWILEVISFFVCLTPFFMEQVASLFAFLIST
jgi:hypothetical protein